MNESDINSIIAKNISVLLEHSGKTQADLADFMGVSQATVSNWCKGTKLPRMDKIDRICEYFNVNRSDLMEDDSRYQSIPSEPTSVRIPVLGSIPAGIPLEAVEDVVDWEDIPIEWTKGGKEFFSLKVKGDSMYPKFIEGDTIILRKQDDCENGDICAVYVNGYDATLKKVVKKQDCIVLQPLNPAYDPKVYDYNDELNPIQIAGVVVEIRRKI